MYSNFKIIEDWIAVNRVTVETQKIESMELEGANGKKWMNGRY
jgi:hypothetical protein